MMGLFFWCSAMQCVAFVWSCEKAVCVVGLEGQNLGSAAGSRDAREESWVYN